MPGESTPVLPPGGTPVAPPDDRLVYVVNLPDDAQLMLNPLGWAEGVSELLERQFGFTLADLLVFLLVSFLFWKILVLFILPGIYFRVMLYTDEMEADRRPGSRDLYNGWTLPQILDAVLTPEGIS